MKVEELLQMLQEKGLNDDQIKGLLKDAMDALGADFEEHDEKEEEKDEVDAEAEKAEAGKLLGVSL